MAQMNDNDIVNLLKDRSRLEQFAHVAIDPEEMKELGIIIKTKEE